MKIIKIIPFVLVALITFTACNDDKKAEKEKMEMEKKQADETAMKDAEMKEAKMKEDKAKAEANSISAKTMESTDLSTLNSALVAADLEPMLKAEGSYTVFAPSNNAFSKLPEGTVEDLMKPENKEMLKSVLQYHVVPGVITSDRLVNAIKGNGGKYTFQNVNGDELTAMMDGDQIVIKDGRNKKAHVINGNIEASNGIVHVVDNVIMAKK